MSIQNTRNIYNILEFLDVCKTMWVFNNKQTKHTSLKGSCIEASIYNVVFNNKQTKHTSLKGSCIKASIYNVGV